MILESLTLVSIKGTGIYSNRGGLIKIDAIESTDILDTLDVFVRLTDLAKLKDGWYEGNGSALDRKAVKKFEDLFEGCSSNEYCQSRAVDQRSIM